MNWYKKIILAQNLPRNESEIYRFLERLGYYHANAKNKSSAHKKYVHPEMNNSVIVRNPHQGEFPPGTAAGIARQMELTLSQFKKLWRIKNNKNRAIEMLQEFVRGPEEIIEEEPQRGLVGLSQEIKQQHIDNLIQMIRTNNWPNVNKITEELRRRFPGIADRDIISPVYAAA